MIDNPALTADLIRKLEGVLPLPAIVTPDLARVLRKQSPHALIPRTCQVAGVFNMGDEGGIMCELCLEGVAESGLVFMSSITTLEFDCRLPLAREIAAYQKRRVKKLRLRAGRDFVRTAGGF
ncbi:MAG: hypothetical protein ABSC06_04570 [Rhodopila sp.]|jgi:hypothetical protein